MLRVTRLGPSPELWVILQVHLAARLRNSLAPLLLCKYTWRATTLLNNLVPIRELCTRRKRAES